MIRLDINLQNNKHIKLFYHKHRDQHFRIIVFLIEYNYHFTNFILT